MAVIKCPGLEVEFRRGIFYGKISGIGELWIETNAVVHGDWWADYMLERRTLHLYFGRTHIAANLPYVSESAPS